MAVKYDRDDCAVFVSNVPSFASQVHLGRHFESIGQVLNVTYNTEKRYAYIQYKWMSEAVRAIEVFDRTNFMGKCIFVSIHKGNKFIKNFPDYNNRSEQSSVKKRTREDDVEDYKDKRHSGSSRHRRDNDSESSSPGK